MVWDIENIDAFFAGNAVIPEIFKNDYKMETSEYASRKEEVADSEMDIMKKILDQIGDKYFYIFTHHDPWHLELIKLQESRVMTFGIDINKIDPEHVYIIIMDKKVQSGAFGQTQTMA